MPVVKVEIWEGLDSEKKEKIVKGMTQVLVDIGIPANATTVILHETPKANWGLGGKMAPKVVPMG